MLGQLPTKLMKWPHRVASFIKPNLECAPEPLQPSACFGPCASDASGDVVLDPSRSVPVVRAFEKFPEHSIYSIEPCESAVAISHFDDPEFDCCFDE